MRRLNILNNIICEKYRCVLIVKKTLKNGTMEILYVTSYCFAEIVFDFVI